VIIDKDGRKIIAVIGNTSVATTEAGFEIGLKEEKTPKTIACTNRP
jgi:hypothetical protein